MITINKGMFFLSIVILFYSCCGTKKEDELLRDFYIQQSRDSSLVVWCYRDKSAPGGELYHEFTDHIYYRHAPQQDGIIIPEHALYYYWYTKGDTLMTFQFSEKPCKGSSQESMCRYKITGDTLFYIYDRNDVYKIGVRSQPPLFTED